MAMVGVDGGFSMKVEALDADLFEQCQNKEVGEIAGQIKGLKHCCINLT